MLNKRMVALWAAGSFVGSLGTSGLAEADPHNVILFIADDYGAISAQAYADQWQSQRYAPTPTINRICGSGVRFLRAWSNPTCSPTRATIMTGRYGFRTGVGLANTSIQPDEVSLPRVLSEAGAPHALLMSGKWHLGSGEELGGARAPNRMGWQTYAGNLVGAPVDHYAWGRTENGVTALSTVYTSSQEVDDAIAFLESRPPNQPFVLWHAFQAPHAPLQKPPVELHDYDDLPETGAEDIEYFEAMVQAMDAEILRLLAALPDENGDNLPDNTTVIFVGDNGTSGLSSFIPQADADTRPAPYEGLPTKGTIYEHGSRVPMCVAGSAVTRPGRDAGTLVHTVDLFATILELAGVSPNGPEVAAGGTSDSRSLVPILTGAAETVRDHQFTEQFGSVHRSKAAALSNGTYKWVRSQSRRGGFTDECFDLVEDPLEENNLLSTGAVPPACAGVRTQLLELVCSESDTPWQDWCS